MKVRAAVAPGIYEMDNGSYRVIARVGDRRSGPAPREKRFAAGTAIRVMKRWQEDTRADLRRKDLRAARGTLAGDAALHLQQVEGRLQYPEHRRYEIESWLPRFGHRRRDTITDREVEQQVGEWQSAGVGASTIRHRMSALSGLYKHIDGRHAFNPALRVDRPAEPRPAPNAVALESVVKTLDALAERVRRNNRGWKTLARARVLAATGMRHSQLMRLRREDIWLDDEPPRVIVGRPGKGGRPHWKPLTADGVTALTMFIDHNAFGPFSQSALYKTWKSACADAAVPFFNPYRLRHTYATTLRAGGMDLADVQQLVGHTSARTTERYAAVAPEKLYTAVGALDRAFAKARTNVERERKTDGRAAPRACQAPQVTGTEGN